MPRLPIVAAILVLLVPAIAPAQKAFEGTVTYRITAGPQSAEVRLVSHGRRLRTETAIPGMPEASSVQIQDAEKKQTVTLMPSRKAYTVSKWTDTEAAARELRTMTGASGSTARPPNITRTGQRATIAGHSCEVVVMGKAQDVEMCIAAEPGPFLFGMEGGGFAVPAEYAGLAADFRDGALLLRLRGKQRGQWEEQMVATAIEPGRVPDSAFDVPAGYQVIQVPSLGGLKLKLPGRKP